MKLLLPGTFIHYFKAFQRQNGNRIFLLVALLVAMSYAEGLGIALFFPLFSGAHGAMPAPLALLFHRLHIPDSPTGVLPFIVVAFVLKGMLSFVALGYQYFLTARNGMLLRRKIIQGLRYIDYRAILQTNAGHYSNLLVSEIGRYNDAFTNFACALPPTLNIVVFFAIVLVLDWHITIVGIALGLVVFALMRVAGRIARRYSAITSVEGETLSSLLIQSIHSFKYLRATATFAKFQERIDASTERLAQAGYRRGGAAAFAQSATQPLLVIFLTSILYYRTAIRHEELASLFVVLMYLFRIGSELSVLQSSWQSFCAFMSSVDLVHATIDDAQRRREPRGNLPYQDLKREIALEHVSFDYLPGKSVLRDVDLKIEKNWTVAFVGDSGSGKSTMVDLITGTLHPTGGRLLIDGQSLAEIDVETMRERIGYVPQDSMLFNDSVANNISLWKSVTKEQLRDAARRARALDFIEAMPEGFDSQVGERGIKLSGGQRQRLAIARELLKDPDILVLDEATSALDSESEKAIQASINALKGRMTILIIAHRLSTIRDCDRIFVLHDQQVVEMGSYQELISRPGSRFQRMCELQRLSPEDGGPLSLES